MQFTLTPVVKALLLINVGVFILGMLMGSNLLVVWLGLFYPASPYFYPYQVVTYMFTHAQGGHLLSNMFGLFMFGPMLERFWGGRRFLIFYLITGVGASLLYTGIDAYQIHHLEQATQAYVQNPTPTKLVGYLKEFSPQNRIPLEDFSNKFEDNAMDADYLEKSKMYVQGISNDIYRGFMSTPMIGASGAIFGIIMAFGLLFPNTELLLLFFPFPIKAKYFVALYGLYEFFAGIQRAPGDNVAHIAHIGGMLFGFILVRYWGSQRDKFY